LVSVKNKVPSQHQVGCITGSWFVEGQIDSSLRFGDDEEPAPRRLAVCLDARLQDQFTNLVVNAVEKIGDADPIAIRAAKINKIRVRTIGGKRLVLEDFSHLEIFNVAVSINEREDIPGSNIEEFLTEEVIVGEQSGGAVLSRHTELGSFFWLGGYKSGCRGGLLDNRGGK